MRNFLTLIMLILGLFESINSQNKQYINEVNQRYSDSISLSILVKRINLTKERAEEAKKPIINNEIYVFGLWPPVSYDGDINWESNPYENRSWYLYFQSLRMIGFLAEDYKYTKDPENIIKTKEILNSWHDYYKDDFDKGFSNLSKSVWNDHAVANRTLNLLHVYFTFSTELELRETILKILTHHGKWLYADENYTTGNHAIMIDRALFQLSQLFDFNESEKWKVRAIERLEKMFDFEVTLEGVCTENSPSYHLYVLDLFIEIINLFKEYNVDYIDEWNIKVQDMKKFSDVIIKPNNTLPIIGDSYYTKHPINLFKKYKDKYLEFNSSFGETNKPWIDKDSYIFPKSGYFIYKQPYFESNNSIGYTDRTYLSFTNTNLSPVHKHNDFLSITLTSNNEDLIVDTGHLGYEKNDITEFTRTTFAHSGITVNELNLNFKELSQSDVLIDHYEIKPEFSVVKASVRFQDYNLERTLIVLKPSTFVFYDKVTRYEGINNSMTINQIFNLGENLKKIERNQNKWKMDFNKNNLIIKQFIKDTHYQEFDSNIEQGNFKGIKTKGYNNPVEGTMIMFTKRSTSRVANLITLIEVVNKNNQPINVEIIDKETSFDIIKDGIIFLNIKK